MQPVLNVEDVKRVESGLTEVGVSISELMHRAGTAAANEVMRTDDVSSVTVFCGLGNNGGDGWVAAESLRKRDIDVTVVTPVAPDDIQGDLARVVAKSAQAAGVKMLVAPPKGRVEELLLSTDVVVDAMLGTGFHGDPRAPFDIWIECINASGATVIAVDVPSGLSAQTGLASSRCVIADMTVTMLVLKPGLLADMGRDACGTIVVAPLAEQTERLVLEADPVAWRADLEDYVDVLAPPSNAVDKFTRGSVLVVGGSLRFPGAPLLAAQAAARSGAGYVTLAVPEPVAPILQSQMPEIPVMGLPSDPDGTFSAEAADIVAELALKRTATLVGPGMRVSGGTVGVVSKLISSEVPLVIDADGLNCLARLTSNKLDDFPELLRRNEPLILTPHRRELGRLVGQQEVPPASLTAAMEAARRIVWTDGGSEITVVAKGSATACVSVDAAVLPKPGPAALATAGSGDVLGGVVAAFLARSNVGNDDLPVLSALACEVHGYAGSIAAERFGSHGVMARDIIDALGLAEDALEEQIAFPESTDMD
ncbi:NAD(P)H-hydrate dehydratase [Parafannyhessea umbonata]|uniref:Bifunctional NAD(P)H-hydrate repair enzyme n=1 Tax=Parafannyhessea umbonata TaxID=604330 RepID=A0A1H9R2K7_9ACTN|nr:NAD(P)H-hydrate dehydratase [Parafannyhessea umbonata]SER66847.1 NAD(P)H-hydrate epimerase [Parafannyhessea umbonata]